MTITFLSKLFFSMHGDLFNFFSNFIHYYFIIFLSTAIPSGTSKFSGLEWQLFKFFFSRFSRFQFFSFSDAKMKEESISFTFYCVESFPFQLQDDPAFKTHSCAFCNFPKKKKIRFFHWFCLDSNQTYHSYQWIGCNGLNCTRNKVKGTSQTPFVGVEESIFSRKISKI